MSRTIRKKYNGEPIRDGQHGKKCPELNCDVCVNGKAKKFWRRFIRRSWRKEQ